MRQFRLRKLNIETELKRIEVSDDNWSYRILRGLDRSLMDMSMHGYERVHNAVGGELGWRGKHTARACNSGARQRLRELLMPSLAETLGFSDFQSHDPQYYVAFITILDWRWDIPDTATKPDLRMLRQAARSVMAGQDFIGNVELVIISNANFSTEDPGKRVCPHLHLIAWFNSRKEMLSWRRKATKQFAGGFFGGRPIWVKPVKSFAELNWRLAYMLKMPVGTKKLIVPKSYQATGNVPKSYLRSGKRTNANCLKLFRLMQQYALDDFMVHGGTGSKIYRDVYAERIVASRRKLEWGGGALVGKGPSTSIGDWL